MNRPFAVALVALALAAHARGAEPDVAPEKLLSPTTQFYLRWDGVTAHNDAYKKSVWGPVMAGPTGDNVRALVAKAPKLLGAAVLADPLLEGQSPAELKANLADLKAAEKLVDLLADKGVIVAGEVREPTPTLKGIGGAVTGLLGGKMPKADAVMPDAQVFVIVPGAAEKAGVLNGSLRLLFRRGEKVEAFEAKGRKGHRLVTARDGAGPLPVPLSVAWWTEGKHFVFYAGTRTPEAVMDEFAANAAKGGLTAAPLYQRAAKLGDFESVARGFVDAARVVGLVKGLAGPLVPGLSDRIEAVGLGSLKAVVFSSGFDGKESRATYEFDAPGERKGFAKALKSTPLGLNDLPPMPPDVSRFSALRLDPAAAYDAGLSLVEFLAMSEQFGVEEEKQKPGELIKARKAYLAREADKLLGVNVKDDILPHLGDKLVLFQSPVEGLSVFGQVVCVSCQDPAKIKAATDNIQRALEGLASSPIKVRKRVLKGVEIREFYARGFGVVTPTYAFVGEWLVVGAHPQAVQGFVLRAKGDLEKWKPDPETAKRLAKMPQDGCGIQFCNPKSTVQNLCCIGPLFLNTFDLRGRFNENESDYDPIDVGLVPNAHELSRHLFPNLTVTRDDGKTVRVEVNESFSIPGEFLGLEPLAFGVLVFGFRF